MEASFRATGPSGCRRYFGVVVDRGQVVWRCTHLHARPRKSELSSEGGPLRVAVSALECARREVQRRSEPEPARCICHHRWACGVGNVTCPIHGRDEVPLAGDGYRRDLTGVKP